MSHASLGRIATIVCALSLALLTSPAPGKDKDEDSWPVKGDLIGKNDKTSKDVSGIACTTQKEFPRSCLVIDDNLQDAQFVVVRDGKLVAGDTINLIANKFKKKRLELDGEGVAFSRGFYYVMGSHGHPRDSDGKLDPVEDAELIKARIAASSQIVRFRAKDGTDAKVERTSNFREMIAAQPDLVPFMDRRLEKNGLTIEGIAVRGDTLFAGFRAPVIRDDKECAIARCAVVLSAPVDALFGDGTASNRLFRLKLDGRGVRDLAFFEDGILVLAGPAASEPGIYAIYSWDGESEDARLLSELTQFAPERKPEGLLPLDKSGGKLRVLIMFDNDPNGAPTPVEVPAP
jgi:Protein of unknown function (DUF3616)